MTGRFELGTMLLLSAAVISTTTRCKAGEASEAFHYSKALIKLAQSSKSDQKLGARKEVLRDRSGSKIGEIERASNQHQILRDEHGNKVGEYDPKANQTRDSHGSLVGTGNLLPGRMDQAALPSKNVLRDKFGSELGEISSELNGRQILRDRHGSKLGEYDPKSNQTRDSHGSLVGTGNLLPGLLDATRK